MTGLILFAGLTIVALSSISGGARILLLPLDHHPNVKLFALSGQHLAEAGHDVLLLTTERHRDTLLEVGVHHILPNLRKAKIPFPKTGEWDKHLFSGSLFDSLSTARNCLDALNSQCEEMLGDRNLVKALLDKKFDIALVDGVEPAHCLYIFPYRLGIPYITLSNRHHPWNARVPVLPSSEGYRGLIFLTPDSSIIDRLVNTVAYIVIQGLFSSLRDDTMIARLTANTSQTTFSQLYQNSEMFLITIDTLCLDVPRVSAPHYQHVGGLIVRPVKTLPSDMLAFVNDAPYGVIIVTFGSAIRTIPPAYADKLKDAFRNVSQRIIMPYQGHNWESLPSNVMVVDWVPQYDLLAHNKTKLFITHAGNNGRMEALHHGVPMLCMPICNDQGYNAFQVKERGFGLCLNWKTFTSEQLLKTIKELLNNPKYKKNIQKCSELVKDFPTPQKTITFWVEHVLKFGSSHLRPPYMQMPLWKFFMLDIILVVLLAWLLMTFLCYRCCRCVGKQFCKKTGKQKLE